MKITIINGPNLNLLGTRETDIYGSQNFESYLDSLKSLYNEVEIDYFQSNVEGEIINFIQKSIWECAAAVDHSTDSLRKWRKTAPDPDLYRNKSTLNNF